MNAELDVSVDLDNPQLYFNQELSWLKFNERVLEQAIDIRRPLLERVRFLSIYANNLDEFFMVRVSGLRDQAAGGVVEVPPDGLTPTQQLALIRDVLSEQLPRMAECWYSELLPALGMAGIKISSCKDLPPIQYEAMRSFFQTEVFPVLTPLAFDPAHPFPHISNLSLNLAVVVRDPGQGERFARLKVPDTFPRLVPIVDGVVKSTMQGISEVSHATFVWLEDVIAANLDMLFPGLDVVTAYPFRITRDADLAIKDEAASDLLTNIEELVELRQWGSVVRMEIDETAPSRISDVLMKNLEIKPDQLYTSSQHLGLASLMELTNLDRPDLKFAPFVPYMPSSIARKGMFDLIREEDQLLYHPYDSFLPVVDLIREAANDPNVLAIKQTLYRVGGNSPIVDALMEARRNGKQVAVLLELQARFDEENNIAWARALEDEGVHVVYGVLGLKTHAKMCLVVRRDPDGLRRYVHLGTGNYNTVTSRIYTDLSYFTCDPDIGADVTDLFNALTGYSHKRDFRKLLVAPSGLRSEIIRRIERETERQRSHGDGYMALKMNALVDKQCIKSLYLASQAGVRIDLQVRGICCLRPGVPGVSETINVTSIIGRFLEHARIYHFRNGGEDEVLIGSADLMPRNLDRRVETVFPVGSAKLRKRIIDDVLSPHLRDNQSAQRLKPDGCYEPLACAPDIAPFNSQDWFMAQWSNGDNS